LHRGACSGAATSEAGEEAWPPSPKWSDRGECQYRGEDGERVNDRYPLSRVWCLVLQRRGGSPSFYRPRRGRFTVMPHYLATCGGMVYSAEELTAVLANLAPITASRRVLCLNRAVSRVEA
jgi:hypothetical protein